MRNVPRMTISGGADAKAFVARVVRRYGGVAQAACVLGVGVSTVRRALREPNRLRRDTIGKLRHIASGRTPRIRKRGFTAKVAYTGAVIDLQAYRRRRKNASTNPHPSGVNTARRRSARLDCSSSAGEKVLPRGSGRGSKGRDLRVVSPHESY